MPFTFSIIFKPKNSIDAGVSQEGVKRIYNSISGWYDVWANLVESKARNRAIELAGIIDRQSILEVAVGTGLAFAEIVKWNPNGVNIGIDISDGMLNKAKKRMSSIQSGNYDLLNASAFNIPFPDGTFDILFNNYMFDLMPFKDMGKILNEFRRVLKKEGKLVLVNMTEGDSFGSNLFEFIYSVSPRIMGGCRPVKMEERVKSSGFEMITREYYQQVFFPSEVILAVKK